MQIKKHISMSEEQAKQYETDLELIRKRYNLPENDSLVTIIAVGMFADEIRAK